MTPSCLCASGTAAGCNLQQQLNSCLLTLSMGISDRYCSQCQYYLLQSDGNPCIDCLLFELSLVTLGA